MKIDASLAAVVTGGASGLGLATVKALRAAGAKVASFDRSEEQGQAAAAETGAIFCVCDVLSDESVDAAFAKARAANGQERALVCCAGGGNAIATARRDKEDKSKINIFPSDQFEHVARHVGHR
jgi:NAD(P)-dependent dehydrogenase (short-subunit alcohol dehydrogenase family)